MKTLQGKASKRTINAKINKNRQIKNKGSLISRLVSNPKDMRHKGIQKVKD